VRKAYIEVEIKIKDQKYEGLDTLFWKVIWNGSIDRKKETANTHIPQEAPPPLPQ
jgi:hypothetical protein